ncbi:hypothetical protein P4O66_022326 [Electrophorus voltai]|uniref:DNA endonuclease Ctp1 N-terminal domain-containing protein n=1 Tax=Electrophorus voltai TaxID=2609070 RepID=A0AAD8ZP48_9TELE|nr:hypothetical protein P4O66_022326 [Electrophorus voltai]
MFVGPFDWQVFFVPCPIGWQEKVLELTNKKNCDAKRLEELYNRNQQLREQQKVLTENIKQLENMLRAGLCDRCRVTQEIATKRQQDYESSQLQSLQHISILMAEISALMKDNSRLRGELKSLGPPMEQRNGESEEAGTPEVKHSPDPASSTFNLITSVLKPEQPLPGGAFAPTATVKSEAERNHCTEPLAEREEISGSDHKQLQDWSGTHPFESNKGSTFTASAVSLQVWRDKRADSADSLLPQLSPTSPSHPHHLRLLKNIPFLCPSSSEERHTLISGPLRPHPIKTAPPILRWPLPEHSDFVTVGTGDRRGGDSDGGSGIVVQPNLNQDSAMLRFPSLLSSASGFESHRHVRALSHLRPLWALPIGTGQKSLSELVDGKDGSKPAPIIAPPCWKSSAVQTKQIFEDGVRDRDEEDFPLDLSNATGSKAKEAEVAQCQCRSEMASTSSSSPDAPLSSPCSAQYCSSPQSDLQTGDSKPQMEKTREKPKEEHDEQKEKNENVDFPGNQKAPTLTISLRPVVILESLKTRQQMEPDAEQGGGPQERQEEDYGARSTRKRATQANEGLPQHPHKEKRIRVTVIPQGSNQDDPEQG